MIPADPILKEFFGLVERHRFSLLFVATKSGVHVQTLRSWQSGKTKRPLYSTINAALKAIGYELKIAPAATSITTTRLRVVA